MANVFPARRLWPLWALAAVSLAWFLASLAVAPGLLPELFPGQQAFAAWVVQLFPPVAVLLLIWAFLPVGMRPLEADDVEARVEVATRAALELEVQLVRIDERLMGSMQTIERLRAAAAPGSGGLAEAAEVLEVAAGTMALASADMEKAAGGMVDLMPMLTAQAREAEASLRVAGGEARRHLETIDSALSQVASHGRDAGREAESMVARMQTLIAQIDQSSAETTKTLANRAYTLDAAVTGVLERSAQAFGSIGNTLSAQARSVEQMVLQARQELESFGSEGTRVIGQRVDVLLGAASQLRQQFVEQQHLSAQLAEKAGATLTGLEMRLLGLRQTQTAAAEILVRDTEAGAAAFEARLETMGARQREAEAQQQARMGDGLAMLEGQLELLTTRQQENADRLQAAMAGAMAGVEGRVEALKARQLAMGSEIEAGAAEVVLAVELRLDRLRERQQEVRAQLEADADAGIAAVEARLQALRGRQQEAALAMQAETAEGIAGVEARFGELDARASESGRQTAELVGRTMAEIGTLGEALAARHDLARGLEERIAGLLPVFDGFADSADARLPELARGLDAVDERGRDLLIRLDQLADRIEGQAALLRDSAAAFERDHGAVVDLSRTLANEFETARGVVGEIHATTEQTAIAAAARMVENVMQVRAAVNATSGEIQSLLSSVVAEAEQRLDDFATEKAEAAFGAPIRLQIAALEDASVKAADAAGGASERLTGRLVALMQVIAETEARVDEVDTRMDVRARDTLAARSIRLVESLNTASIDVARLLSVDVGDSAWAKYLKGDRSLFARATVRLADKETSRRISRHFAHDDEFQGEASRYLEQFEALVRRVLIDPDGEAFALVLLSSDIGKLYVMIAQAIGRPLPRAE